MNLEVGEKSAKKNMAFAQEMCTLNPVKADIQLTHKNTLLGLVLQAKG